MNHAPMLGRAPRRGHIHCDCPGHRHLKPSHKRKIREYERGLVRAEVRDGLEEHAATLSSLR